MKEILQLEKGNLDYRLKNYYLSVYEGDIVYIQGAFDGSIKALWEVLSGERSLDSGELFLYEEKVDNYNNNTTYIYGIKTISPIRCLVEKMTVEENLGAVRPVSFPGRIYQKRRMRKEIEKSLIEEGIHAKPQTLVWQLSELEKNKIEILKAKAEKSKIVIMDISKEYNEGKMAEELKNLIYHINTEDGVTFVILSECYSPLLEIATRVQLVLDGKDRKEWHGLTDDVRECLKNGSFLEKNKQITENVEKNFIGLYDYEWEEANNIWRFLEVFRVNNPKEWRQWLDADIPEYGNGIKNRTVIVTRDSADCLLKNLSIGENLTIALTDKIGVVGVIKRNLQKRLEKNYYEEQRLECSAKRVKDLTRVQRKILSIARWELKKPAVMILESPYSGMNQEEEVQIRTYLQKLHRKGIRIIYFSKNPEDFTKDCSKMIYTNNGKSAKINTF